MIDKVKISSFQLAVLIIGFILGSSIVFNPAYIAGSDAWIVIVFSLISGIALICIYSLITILNPGKTLVSIMTTIFGKVIGTFIVVLYLWYFIHLLSLVLRDFLEFALSTIYVETPIVFLAIVLMFVCTYRVKKGLEVIARVTELLVPFIAFTIILVFFALISRYDVNYFFPVLENGFKPILESSLFMMTFPYGELVVFLMIFPHLNKHEIVLKIANISVIIAGFLLLVTTAGTLMVLGPTMIGKIIYPNFTSVKFVPEIHFEVLVAINYFIGAATKGSILLYSLSMGISQLFKLDDYKPLVVPLSIFTIALSLWGIESFFELSIWSEKVYPYYALPFQVIIPIFVLFISIIKNKKSLSTN